MAEIQYSSHITNGKDEVLSEHFFAHNWRINNFEEALSLGPQPIIGPPFKVYIKGQGEREFWIEISEVESKVHFKVHFSHPTLLGGCMLRFKKESRKIRKSKLKDHKHCLSRVTRHLTFNSERQKLPLVGGALEMYFYFYIQIANYIAKTIPTQIDLLPLAQREVNREDMEFLSDFEIECEGRTFSAHKLVLANHSDVFRAMFTHRDTEESKTNKVNIPDLSAETMDFMLQIMYKQKVPENLTQADLEALLEASNKYNFHSLYSYCENRLKDRCLNWENSARLMLIGLKFNSKGLADKAKQVVLDNIQEVIQMKDYEELMRAFPDAFTKVSEGTKKRKASADCPE